MSRTLSLEDPAYPPELRELSRPPPAVQVRGAWPLAGRRVAIVGARGASAFGLRKAEELGRALSAAGLVVVSGGARGVDAAAHRGALAGPAPTLVVLPTDLATPAPSSNRRLFAQVLERGGAWLSEHQGPPTRAAFCQRNRLIAALAELVVLIEARLGSGTRYTVEAARRLQRPVAALPWAVDDPRGAYCVEVLRRGAHVVSDAQDVLTLLGLRAPAAPGRRARAAPKEPPGSLEARVLEALSAGESRAARLAATLGAPASAVACALVDLELQGRVRRRGPGVFQRS